MGLEGKRAVLVRCPHCGKQNLIAAERLKHLKERPVKCWSCQREIPVDVIEKAIS